MLTLKRYTLLKDLVLLTIAMFIGSLGWAIFLLPNHITTGGIPGLASILYWGLNIPVQVTFLGVNALLLLIALKVLGWQFCIKTLYAAVMFTIFSAFATLDGRFNPLARPTVHGHRARCGQFGLYRGTRTSQQRLNRWYRRGCGHD